MPQSSSRILVRCVRLARASRTPVGAGLAFGRKLGHIAQAAGMGRR
jgi:hypothetical protein